jgi:hypothetical protein
MSTTPSRPNTKPEPSVDDKTRRIIEERLATAAEEPRQDLRKAVEERLARRKT